MATLSVKTDEKIKSQFKEMAEKAKMSQKDFMELLLNNQQLHQNIKSEESDLTADLKSLDDGFANIKNIVRSMVAKMNTEVEKINKLLNEEGFIDKDLVKYWGYEEL